jgi:hypothetical protein
MSKLVAEFGLDACRAALDMHKLKRGAPTIPDSQMEQVWIAVEVEKEKDRRAGRKPSERDICDRLYGTGKHARARGRRFASYVLMDDGTVKSHVIETSARARAIYAAAKKRVATDKRIAVRYHAFLHQQIEWIDKPPQHTPEQIASMKRLATFLKSTSD